MPNDEWTQAEEDWADELSKKALRLALCKKHSDCITTIELLVDLLHEERERLAQIEALLKDSVGHMGLCRQCSHPEEKGLCSCGRSL